jgi:hypothetical protein
MGEQVSPIVITCPPTVNTSCDESGTATDGQRHDDTGTTGCAADPITDINITSEGDGCACGHADADDDNGTTLELPHTSADTTSKSEDHEGHCHVDDGGIAHGRTSPWTTSVAADAVSTTNSHGDHGHAHGYQHTQGYTPHVDDHTHGSMHNAKCDDVIDDPNEAALIGLEGTVFARALIGALTHAGASGSGGGSPAAVEELLEIDATADSKTTRKRNQAVLIIAFASFFVFAVAEVLGGIFGNSLALASDASTMLVDALTYLLNLLSERKKAKATPRQVLLYELISPTFSLVALLAATIYILVSAASELDNPDNSEPPNIIIMWCFTLINLSIDIVNVVLFVVERRRKTAELKRFCVTSNESNANMLSALTHVAIDTMRTLSVFVALMCNWLAGLDPSAADACVKHPSA